MQVAHTNDHITHAIIGGAQTIDFGISSSAEFFNILSSTLYKDQILAVVREVLCNAWDAHIEAGITDRAVEVLLDQDKFVIRDFGSGIHRDDMGLIYGTYGNSTKKNDGSQTGGFGLGCKAPFAYTDHFEVISCHDGVKTIYNLSKSSAQAMGKPGIVPIASFPTEETGLQVSISLKSPNDKGRFTTLVNRIARNGDMKMTHNGGEIDRLGFDSTKSNYMLTTQDNLMDTPSDVMVRYGNVVYPVDYVGDLQNNYSKIRGHLATLKNNYRSYRIIFQAPPHSISVTPSRESLSMQEHTIKTMNKLMGDYMAMILDDLPVECEKFAEEVTIDAVKEVRMGPLLSREVRLPGEFKTLFQPMQIKDLHSLAHRYMQSNYPSRGEFRKNDITRRLKLMATEGLLDRGMVQTYLRTLDSLKGNNNNGGWLQRSVIGPLMAKLMKSGLDHKRLYVYDPEDLNVSDAVRYRNAPPLVLAESSCPRSIYHALPYLRNIVVLSTAKTEINDRAKNTAIFKERGQYPGYLFYHVGMKKVDKDNAVAFFKATGMEVVDLINEPVSTSRNWASASRKPVQKGVVALSNIMDIEKYINTRWSRDDNALRNEAPEFVVQIPFRRDVSTRELPGWDRTATQSIVALFGDKGGITSNSAVHLNWIRKGVKQFDAYILEKVCHQMKTNPRIQEYWAFHPDRVNSANMQDNSGLINCIYGNPTLCKAFKLVNNLTEEDKHYMCLWAAYTERSSYHWKDEVKVVAAHLETIPLSKFNTALLEKIKKSSLISMLDYDGLIKIFNKNTSDEAIIKKAISVLITILNN